MSSRDMIANLSRRHQDAVEDGVLIMQDVSGIVGSEHRGSRGDL